MAILTVGVGQTYTTIAAAVSASSSGDTINVLAGTYTNDFATISHNLTIQGVGGAVNLVATQQPPNGKAIIDEGGSGVSVTLSGLSFSGATVGDGNGAGIRYEGGTLTLNNDTFTGNQEGILGAADPNGVITISNSTFNLNGSGTGSTHGIYIGAIASLTVQNSTVENTLVGHDIKSRAASNTITGDTIIETGGGTASYEIDLPNGGVASISGNVIEKGANAQNPVAISYGEEGGTYATNSLSVTGNLIVNDYTAHSTTAVRNSLSGVTATVSGNTFYGWTALTGGNASLSGNTVANTEPALVLPGLLPSTSSSTDPLFDAAYYLLHNPDVAAAGVNPLLHFSTYGWKEGRNPDAFFDVNYYLAQNPDVKAAGINPLQHFELYGWKEGREPSLLFSGAKYLAANPDVKAAGLDPLQHYLANGQAKGRATFLSGGTAVADLLVNPAYYDPQLGATLIPTGTAAAQQAAWSYDAGGWKQGLNPDAWFNTAYYLAQNPDVAAAHIDPLLHYETYGWKEGRNPSAQFSTLKYEAAYADVKAAGVDPLLHYVQYGQTEGRQVFSV